MRNRNWLVNLGCLFWMTLLGNALAESHSKLVPLEVEAGAYQRIDLHQLLKLDHQPDSTFTLDENLPSWIEFDPWMHTLHFSPGLEEESKTEDIQIEFIAEFPTRNSRYLIRVDVVSPYNRNRRPKFKSSPVLPIEVVAGKEINIKFREDLLVEGQSEELTFGVVPPDAPLPSWLTVNTASETMTGKPGPGDVGVNARFTFAVKNNFDEGDKTDIEFRVKPGWKSDQDLDLGIQPERVKFTKDLKTEVVGPSTGLQFQATGLQDWMTEFSTDGVLSGTPQREDVGPYSRIEFKVTHIASGLFTTIKAFGEVTKVPIKPTWKSNRLPDGFEAKAYSESAALLVDNPEGFDLNFKLNAGPSFIQMDTSGQVFGNPDSDDVSTHTLDAEFSYTLEGVPQIVRQDLSLTIQDTNQPPRWKSNPVVLPDAITGKLYTQDLSGSVVDPDGDDLTFTKVSGPDWVEVKPDGRFVGTPNHSDGSDSGTLNTVVVRVSDGQFSPAANIQVKVFRTNQPPFWKIDPTVLPNAKEDGDYSQSLVSKVEDPDGDPVEFILISGPDWANVTLQGVLQGKPGKDDLGLQTFEILVRDNISGGNTGKVQVTVDHTNHPPDWTLSPINIVVDEDSPMNKPIHQWATDVDGDPLKFEIILGDDDWVDLSEDGVFTGIPRADQVGDNTFTVRVSDGKGGTADNRVVITVNHVNHPPKWTQDPVVLPNAKERESYSGTLADYATDPDIPDPGDELKFSLVPGSGSSPGSDASWVQILPDGTITGTPQRIDLGLNKFRVRVRDKGNLDEICEIQITVDRVNIAPIWIQTPMVLPNAFEDKDYEFDISTNAFDEDGDSLRFDIVEAPAWIKINDPQTGILTGVPGKDDVGNYTAKFKVTDVHGASAIVNATGKVIHTNHTPVIHQDKLTFEIKEREERTIDLSDKQYVDDPDDDNLTFTLLDGADWIALSPIGLLDLKPKHEHIGTHQFRFEVFDGEFKPQGTLTIKVLEDPRPPVWLENPIQIIAEVNLPLPDDLSIKSKASDPDDRPLTFTKVSGPDWLTISQDGTLSGHPKTPDLGQNQFKVKVTNDAGLSATPDLTLIVDVQFINHKPICKQTPIKLPNATINKNYTKTVSEFVEDPDGDDITFKKQGGPSWAFVTSSGLIIGKPLETDKGTNRITVRASDGELFADCTAEIEVGEGNNPPVWIENPVKLGNIEIDKAFVFDLKTKVTDADGDQLFFRLVNGPVWMEVSQNGVITGTPTHLGDFNAIFEVNDTIDFVQAGGTGTVVEDGGGENNPPVWESDPINLGELPAGSTFTLDLNTKASDPDGDDLTFSKVSGPDWLTVQPNGTLTANPTNDDIGSFIATFSVTDQKANVNVGAIGKVVEGSDNLPPKWEKDPLDLGDLIAGETYRLDLTTKVTDPDGDDLSFSKLSGPDWLTVEPNGQLTAKPTSDDIGSFIATFSVTDQVANVDVGAIGRVIEGTPNQPPKWVNDPLDLGDLTAGQEFILDLKTKATDPDGDPLTFSKISGPDWLTVAPDGKLSAKPTNDDIGAFVAKFSVTDQKADVDVDAIGKVVEGAPNTPPNWKQDPIDLGNIKANRPFNFDLAPLAEDADGDTLTFSKKSGPDWLEVASDGKISGGPTDNDLGSFVAKFTVSDGQASVDVDALGKVIEGGVNNPPQWNQDPIDLGNLSINKKFELDISNLASDPDGDALTFSKESGPDWLSLSSSGVLSGTPTKLGAFVARFKVTDGLLSDSADALGKVVEDGGGDNKPPVWKQLKFSVTERENFNKNINTTQYVDDPDGDNSKMRFAIVTSPPPSWVSLSSEGNLGILAKYPNIGTFTYQVSATDEEGASSTQTLEITVTPSPRNPEWLENPILYTTPLGILFSENLSTKARDPDGRPIRFSKVTGASWLSVQSNGTISGTPPTAEQHTFDVRVTNEANLSADAKLIITVVSDDPEEEEHIIDAPRPGALVDNLWVIDSSRFCNQMIKLLKKHIHVYYDELNRAGVKLKHSGVYLSSDYHRWGGTPVRGPNDALLMKWSDPSVVDDFKYRVQRGWSVNLYSSPIWSMYNFYEEKLPKLDEFKNGYFEKNVPMEVMIMTRQGDHLKKFNQGSSTKNWSPKRFAEHFVQFHQENEKPYRISTFAPDCRTLEIEEGEENRWEEESADALAELEETNGRKIEPSAAYKPLTDETGGKYYVWCEDKMQDVLSDYAREVIRRAFISDKTRIRLQKAPSDPSQIRITLNGLTIPGNTGSSSDKWTYDGSSQEVVIYWYKFDLSEIPVGAKLRIQYPA